MMVHAQGEKVTTDVPSLVFYERDERVRERLVELLTSELPEMTPLGQALDAEQLLTFCRTGRWDVAVIDVTATNEIGFKLLWRLRQDCPRLPLVVLSFNLDMPWLAELRALGVLGLVAAEDVTYELPTAVRAALAGEQYLSQSVRTVIGQPIAA